MKAIDETDLRQILSEVFPSAKLPYEIEGLKMGDIIQWDSLGNFNLLLAIEESFDIRFSMNEISEIKSLREIIEAVNRHYV